MKIPERLHELRTLMAEKGIDIYVVPTADFHQSEYVGEHFKARKYITGFTGSAGTAVITQEESGLWTDGRYFLQAGEQLKETTVKLFKMGEPGVPSVEDYVASKLPKKGTLGFDGRVISMGEGQAFENVIRQKDAMIQYSYDLIDDIWTDRPPLSEEPAFALGTEYTGESTQSKLSRVRSAMKDAGATAHIITSLDDVAWLLNIRGNDIEFFPLVLSYAIVTMEKADLFIDERKLSESMKADLEKDGVILHPYNDIYESVKNFTAEDVLLIDPDRMNYALYNNIGADVKKVEMQNPTVLMKAIKNPVEIENIKKAHVKDGVAHTKFMYWLKHQIGKETITEMSASDKLEAFRAEQEGFIRPSFEPICAFGEHGAIVHYCSTPETNVELKEGTLFLTDTGGGYYEGSTDITRTVALGEIPQYMKDHFTATVESNLQLAHARFLYGCNGVNLDILARTPFWRQNLNYNHGTGHGVGYLMNIHEAPTGIRWQYRPSDSHQFEEGMIITDEPGIYIAGSHGIRIENELLVCKGEKNEYGQFMYFEPITYVPFDLDAINPDLLTAEEKVWLNEYHKTVYDTISPYLSEEENEWLKEYTREI
ncbi:aminopeptidase P family N-terminal domain-containing protein [Faecalicatena sp. AGMB00832]|uniref:Aminopeptidase P family N-terminal domain-containing protein n=1 Tax=Faecalicatena faecalis TaxID=2726362 RepID=A0ABS6D135_9FIRM|nr:MULTISPECIES: aminopeptidase P family N-terminal domain-containing protein [Faecalicatena]MBU3875191.1 aminopeptidase P family N-terminal domain-containing protein [Faecalicatena faecalis]MCI6467820.1 aminopeptidase P family N-terminal domain-containing protein [Faecalicatena sp.]MDY5619538.1 aminopeptidase P family N-terminal domain-containing protein [Lachnospiraceae bacterium]